MTPKEYAVAFESLDQVKKIVESVKAGDPDTDYLKESAMDQIRNLDMTLFQLSQELEIF